MWNLLKNKKKKTEKELRDLSAVFSILDEFEKRGVIHWQRKNKVLLIEEVLGTLKVAEGRDGFLRFLNQVSMWQNHRLLAEAYESLRLKVETEAVRKARAQFVMLTKADMQRIRQNALALTTKMSNSLMQSSCPSGIIGIFSLVSCRMRWMSALVRLAYLRCALRTASVSTFKHSAE